MPLVTTPELQGLLAIAREEGLDMKPILLRFLTDLYVAVEAHTADEAAQYQDIAGTLASQVDGRNGLRRCLQARRLSRHPVGVAEAIVARRDDAARILLADAGWLPPPDGAGGGRHRRRLLSAAVAARADLDGR